MSDKSIFFVGWVLLFLGMVLVIGMSLVGESDLVNILIGYMIGVGIGLVFYSGKKYERKKNTQKK